MVQRSYKQTVDPLESFKLSVIVPIAHELLEIRLLPESKPPSKYRELELEYARYAHVNEKDIKKEYWECILAEKNSKKEVPTKLNAKLERVKDFNSDTHYLFRIVPIKN